MKDLYAYDGLQRLDDFDRGSLNAAKDAITSLKFAQQWSLDATGNWSNFKQDDNGDGTWDLDQDRTANKVNEITGITETAGPAWTTPAYSRAGNMTTVPQPVDLTASYAAAFDAWNRLVTLTEGANTVQENEYDGLRRRTVRQDYTGGSLDETRHFYYSQTWQVLEERLNTSADPDRQFVWGLRYIDDCVLRDRDTTGDGTLDERLYAMQDANWNVTAVADTGGDIQERYAYQAYGQPLFLDPNYTSRTASSFDWETLFAGYRWDQSTELYLVRNRVLHPLTGTWVQRDPLLEALTAVFGNAPLATNVLPNHDFLNVLNQYQYADGNSLNDIDPSGLAPEWQRECKKRCPLPPPQGPPKKGDPCHYPNRKVCYKVGVWPFSWEACWESQCVCQCVGPGPGLNCMRGCISCADKHGAPKHTIEAEQWCQKNVCDLSHRESKVLNCCTQNDSNLGGCRGSKLAAPLNPRQGDDRCKNIKEIKKPEPRRPRPPRRHVPSPGVPVFPRPTPLRPGENRPEP